MTFLSKTWKIDNSSSVNVVYYISNQHVYSILNLFFYVTEQICACIFSHGVVLNY